MSRAFDETDLLCINTVRTLSLDAVEKAKSGHPGLPLGCAPLAHALWSRHLRFNPVDPHWPGRDRFVLSAGHGCMLLYSLLHLTGYDLPIEELESFRQWGSRTPGHPEYRHTEGVETTTGPLGQGAATGVGMAIAGKHLGARYGGPAGFRVFVIVSDGDLMEGVSGEASSLAGHLGLDNLVFLYDDNHVSIDGDTEIAFTEDRVKRYDAYGWETSTVSDGNDLDELDAAITAAIAVKDRPAFVAVKTIIGYGSRDAGTHRAHSDARGAEQQAETKRTLGFDPDKFFFVPALAAERYHEIGAQGAGLQAQWETDVDALPDAAELRQIYSNTTPSVELAEFMPDDGPIATRAASGKVLAQLAKQVPQLMGGSADLTPSNNTQPPDWIDFQPTSPEGRYLRFGVREHAMTAAINGMALSGIRPYGGTFFNFMDYAKPAVRLAGLMGIPSVYVYTHDSIGLGEDGPTHQPIEQLATLRATPHITVFRPADANETAVGWRIALERDTPTVLVLTRQGLPILDTATLPVSEAAKGGYVLEGDDDPEVVLIATGSEVHLIQEARGLLTAKGTRSRVVSLPSWELFEEQTQEYRESVIPPHLTARVTVEAAATLGWERYAGLDGVVIGLERFGASAPGGTVMKELGFTAERVADAARRLVDDHKSAAV